MRLIVLVMVSLIFFLSVSAGQAQEAKVLLASSGGDFKEAVVLKLNKVLQEAGLGVNSVELKALKKESSFSYEVIVLINSCWAWQLDKSVRGFLKKTKEEELAKIILLTTAGNPDWKAKVTGVDALTAASQMNDVDLWVEQIKNKIISKINS